MHLLISTCRSICVYTNKLTLNDSRKCLHVIPLTSYGQKHTDQLPIKCILKRQTKFQTLVLSHLPPYTRPTQWQCQGLFVARILIHNTNVNDHHACMHHRKYVAFFQFFCKYLQIFQLHCKDLGL
jgi:hypothetical protein